LSMPLRPWLGKRPGGPRLNWILYNAVRLALDNNGTLLDIPTILTDKNLRTRFLKRASYRPFWEEEFEVWDDRRAVMSSYIDFADVKARCSIEQAAKLLGLQTSEESSQLRAPCPACGNGSSRAIVITPARNLFHCFPSKAGGDQIALVSPESKRRSGLDARSGEPRYCTERYEYWYSTSPRQVSPA
jgi:hypothetical protein